MDQAVADFEKKIQALLGGMKQELTGVRTNRPTPQLIESIKVEYAGQLLMIKQLGSISVQLPRDLVVTVWDTSVAGAVAKAIEHASLGLTPSTDGQVVRIKIPPLTEERRAEFVKLVKSMAEKARIRLRAERDEVNKKIGRAADEKKINEDQKFKFKERVQKAVDKVNGEIETVLQNKIREVNE